MTLGFDWEFSEKLKKIYFENSNSTRIFNIKLVFFLKEYLKDPHENTSPTDFYEAHRIWKRNLVKSIAFLS